MNIIIAAGDHWYTNGTVIGIAGVAVGVVGIIAAIVLWRFGAPRGQLEYSMLEPKALVSQSPRLEDKQLRVTFNKKVVQNPYLVTLQFTNRGRRDIRSEDFDRQRPLIFRLNAEVVDLLQSPDPENQMFSLGKEGRILLHPTLIPRSESFSLDVLTDGMPTLSFDGKLADVNMRIIKYPEFYRSTKSVLPFIGSGILMAIGYDIAFRTPHTRGPPLIGITTMAVAALLFISKYIQLDRYVRRAKKRFK